MNNFINKVLDLLYPPHYSCVICHEEINGEIDICEHCLRSLPYLKDRVCLRCGQVLHDESEYCDNCKYATDPWYFDLCRSLVSYTYPITNLLRSIKYDNAKYLFPTLGKFLTHLYEENELDCDVIIPVPLHPKRYKTRGYNQAEELARDLSITHNIPIDTEHLIKIKDTKSQTEHSGKARRDNVKDSFDLTIRHIYKDKIVLLIDDIYTSGATINECARILKEKGGAAQVIALTIAHSPVRDTSKKIK